MVTVKKLEFVLSLVEGHWSVLSRGKGMIQFTFFKGTLLPPPCVLSGEWTRGKLGERDDGVAQDGKGKGDEKLSDWESTLDTWVSGLPVGF